MKDKDFVESIIDAVLNYNLKHYQNSFDNLSIKLSTVQDGTWKNALEIYSKLNREDKKKYMSFLRTVISDTISSMLCIIDGVSFLKNQEEEFKLTYKQHRLNGDLQDLFLEKLEDDT